MKLLFFCALLAVGAATSIDGCTFTSGSNDYDLSSLHSATYYKATGGPFDYDFNVCGQVVGVSNCPGMMCQYLNGNLAAVIALWETPTWSLLNAADPKSGLTFTMSNGVPCDIEGVSLPRVSIWQFPCTPGGKEYTSMTVTNNVANLTNCQATYVIPTSASCPGHGGHHGGGGGGGGGHKLSGGWVFIILVIVFSVLYCAVGGFMNHRKGATGADLCPNRDFWAGLPGLVKDGFGFTIAKIRGCIGGSGGGGGGYQQTA